MEIIIEADSRQASLTAARIVAATVREKPRAVLGLATGRTPRALYEELGRMHREEGLDFSGATSFNLDEYAGLDPAHPASFHAYLRENLFCRINIPEERIHTIDGLAGNIPAFCEDYESAIRNSGGIDIQILGIGRNGHIGFNEPSSSLSSRTRITTLAVQTRTLLAQEFGGLDKVPRHVLTMGLGTIMESRLCLLLAFGASKAWAVSQSVEGPITAMVPASILQMHPRAVFLLDREAASALKLADYYSWVYENKPAWQKP